MMQHEREAACKYLLQELASNTIVQVYVQSGLPGVVVPAHVQSTQFFRLDLSYHFSPPIADLNVDEDGITGTFSFSGVRSLVVIPWHAVVQIGTPTKPAKQDAAKIESMPAAKSVAPVSSAKTLPPGWRVIEGCRGNPCAACRNEPAGSAA